MKRTLITLTSILVLSASLTIPASGAVKAGSVCSKAGATSIAAGKKFTCVKYGKKLSWNKGTAIAKPTPSPSPSTGEPGTQTSSPSPAPSLDQVVAKTSEFPTSFANLEERYQGIPYAVWDKIQTNLGLHKSSQLKISFLFGPNTPQRYPDQWTINALTLGSRVMGSQKQPSEIKFIQYNKEDVSWARTEASKYLSPFNLGINFADQASEKCSGEDCDGAVTNMTTDIGLVLVGVSSPVNRFNIQKFNGQNDLHEYTHAVQGMVFKGKTKVPPSMQMPCWFAEGQPQAISIPTLAKSAEDYVKIRKSWITDNRWVLKDYEPETIQTFLKDNMQAPCPSNTYSMLFSLGYIVMDALIAVGGVDKTFEVQIGRADGLTFEESFKRAYGISWDEASIALSRTVSTVYKEIKK
jgi:hypothetical protein